MANPYHDFTAQPIAPHGYEALNQGVSGLGQAFAAQVQQKKAEQDAIRLLIMKAQLDQQNAAAEANAKQQAEFNWEGKRLERARQMNPGQFGGVVGTPINENQNFDPFNPIQSSQVPARISEFDPMTGKSNQIDNPVYKKLAHKEQVIQDEILKGPAEAAVGKVALAKESLRNIDDVIKRLFPDGTPKSFKRTTAFASNIPGGMLPILPQRGWGEAEQDVFRKMGASLSARQLIQTGVAARPEETNRLIAQFTPSFGSNPEAALRGLQELKQFYEEYLNTAEPAKRLGSKTGGIKQSTGAYSSGISEGQTATNPKTGEKIVYKGGKWQPMK